MNPPDPRSFPKQALEITRTHTQRDRETERDLKTNNAGMEEKREEEKRRREEEESNLNGNCALPALLALHATQQARKTETCCRGKRGGKKRTKDGLGLLGFGV